MDDVRIGCHEIAGKAALVEWHLTDEDSRIMPVAGGGFEQCYNAQAFVAEGSLLVVVAEMVQAANDKQQLAPMVDKITALPDEVGRPDTLLADSGYFSAANVDASAKAGIEPLIATGRQPHYPPLSERLAKVPPSPENPTPVEAMAHRLRTPEGKKLYALRKQTPEPVFGLCSDDQRRRDAETSETLLEIRPKQEPRTRVLYANRRIGQSHHGYSRYRPNLPVAGAAGSRADHLERDHGGTLHQAQWHHAQPVAGELGPSARPDGTIRAEFRPA